ncbi:MAG: hydrogenase maturation nickel metallochaperone HypA, partial [Acetobacter sp.]|nr:hydrogenase maturation nickel metallochaperone HypA [Acetobacter sp.]
MCACYCVPYGVKERVIMHEISLCESLLDIIGDCAKRDGFTRVRRIVLEIGPFAGVEISALRFGFEA